ncbi:MAG: aminofutalosine synthase MqnE [Pseudomonadota bacterium]
MNQAIKDAGIEDIFNKVEKQQRLSFEDGVRLYRSDNLLALGSIANMVREKKNGNRAYYIYNQHVNYSNICVNLCRFCAFGKDREDPAAYEMTIEEIVEKIKERIDEPISEVHIVGGLNPDLPYGYYLEMLREIKKVRPSIHIQAFTVVEIAHLAHLAEKPVETVIEELKEAGLGSIPGGGAEVFSTRIRERLCPKKLSPEGWLDTAKIAHKAGLRSNATMLYGHIETYEERIEHLIALRNAQDETGGFLTFIPLAFHPRNTDLASLSPTTGFEDLKNIAVARLMLDNFDHIKAYWVMIGPKLAQIALSFGADDIDGTVIEEKITHMAGAETSQALTRNELRRVIRAAGREPVERDTLYNEKHCGKDYRG